MARLEAEANPPLVVDPDAPPALAVSADAKERITGNEYKQDVYGKQWLPRRGACAACLFNGFPDGRVYVPSSIVPDEG